MVGFLDDEQLAANYRACALYTRRHAKTFYFASHLLPPRKRRAAYALYAFCRYADNLVDLSHIMLDTGQTERELQRLRDQLRYVYSLSPLMDPRLCAFRDAVFTYAIPQEYFLELLRGVETDISPVCMNSFAELQVYCYRVASVVGLMMTRVFGVTDPTAYAAASDLGTAMQLTNILRDIGEDARRGRVYVPMTELRHFGVTGEDLCASRVTPQFRALMEFQIARARQYYARADSGIPLVTDDGSRYCVRVMSRTYAGILARIEANGYDVFTRRAFVGPAGKLLLAVRSAGIFNRRAVPAPAQTPDDQHSAVRHQEFAGERA